MKSLKALIYVPLLDVELDHVIPDELHLMLRVMGVLIQALLDTTQGYKDTSMGCQALTAGMFAIS